MFRRIFSFKKCCICSNKYISGNNVLHCPTCNSSLNSGNVAYKLGLGELLGINNFFNFDKDKKCSKIKEIPDKEIVDEQESQDINKQDDQQKSKDNDTKKQESEDSGYDTDSEYESDSEEDILPYDVNDYIVNNYEKDLEMAINLSLKNKEFCVVCFDKSINAVFIPCGHYCCCYKCAKKCSKKCPICRKKIKLVQKIYK